MKLPASGSLRRILLRFALDLGVVALIAPYGYADQILAGWEASNMTPIGYSDLGGHEAFKMAIKHVGDRWYLYLGHFVAHGWSIVDVTDPKNPQVVKFIPGPENTSAGQVDLHDNILITPLQDRAGYGGDPNKQVNEGLLIWDIHDPVNPKQMSWWKTGATGTHRDGYPGGKYVNMSAGIGVNTHHAPARQNFTTFHELGHLLLHDQEKLHIDNGFRVRLRDDVSSQGTDDAEREANLFAASLLMPRRFLEEDLESEEYVDLLDDDFLSDLARKYGVSSQALVNRLKNLGYIPE
jgi:hypothetical protein